MTVHLMFCSYDILDVITSRLVVLVLSHPNRRLVLMAHFEQLLLAISLCFTRPIAAIWQEVALKLTTSTSLLIEQFQRNQMQRSSSWDSWDSHVRKTHFFLWRRSRHELQQQVWITHWPTGQAHGVTYKHTKLCSSDKGVLLDCCWTQRLDLEPTVVKRHNCVVIRTAKLIYASYMSHRRGMASTHEASSCALSK